MWGDGGGGAVPALCLFFPLFSWRWQMWKADRRQTDGPSACHRAFWFYRCTITPLWTAWEGGHVLCGADSAAVSHYLMPAHSTALCWTSAWETDGSEKTPSPTLNTDIPVQVFAAALCLCVLSAHITSQMDPTRIIPSSLWSPNYARRATTGLGDIHEWIWLDSWAPLAETYARYLTADEFCDRLSGRSHIRWEVAGNLVDDQSAKGMVLLKQKTIRQLTY